ncbi:MAG: nitroreductase family protein [Dysgonamonadaceae bacterium]|jgi:nitroreductase|nr:nitroreductase family protein [Dysgonamonadaceae bacterium]
MELDKVIQQRKSVRKYTDEPVSKEIIESLLESARLAPSAVNYQPWKFIVCTSEEAKCLVRESYPREWFNDAPVYIVACGNHNISWKRADGKDHCNIDVAIAVQHIVLKVHDIGLGTCWVCNFDAQKLKNDLKLEEQWEPIAILPIGYPKEIAGTALYDGKRKSLEEITVWI